MNITHRLARGLPVASVIMSVRGTMTSRAIGRRGSTTTAQSSTSSSSRASCACSTRSLASASAGTPQRGDDGTDGRRGDDEWGAERPEEPHRSERVGARELAGHRPHDDERDEPSDEGGSDGARPPPQLEAVRDVPREEREGDERYGFGHRVRDGRGVRGRLRIGRQPRDDGASPVGPTRCRQDALLGSTGAARTRR